MNKFTKLNLLAIALVTILFSACKKEYESIQAVDDTAIQAYIKKNSLNMIKSASGYYYSAPDSAVTDVDKIKNSDSVFYSYTFKTLTGQVLNSTSNVMIPGTFLGYTDRFTIGGTSYIFTPVREVLSKLKRGGKGTLIMPSSMAFGKNGLSAINVGSNENVIVELGVYTQNKIHDINELEINNFLTANNLTALKDPSRIRYIVTQQGTGTDVISQTSTLSVNYTGRLLNGTTFDASNGTPISIVLSEAIKGWSLLTKYKAGTKIRLFIPSDLAYGQAGSFNSTFGTYTIPPNAVLDFDIEIISVTN